MRDAIVNHSGDNAASTLEGKIIKLADRIAYINHDIDDAIRAKILRPDDLPKKLTDILGDTHSKRIGTLVSSVIEESTGKNDIIMDGTIHSAMLELREFLFENVYRNPEAKGEEGRAMDMLKRLYEYFVQNSDKMPEEYNIDESDSVERRACDYICGMTDRYAINTFERIFVPKVWK